MFGIAAPLHTHQAHFLLAALKVKKSFQKKALFLLARKGMKGKRHLTDVEQEEKKNEIKWFLNNKAAQTNEWVDFL